MTTTGFKAGLEDVIAARSAICQVDGSAGRLYYRGYEIGDLTAAVTFEDVTALLWFGELPAPPDAFRACLRDARGLPRPSLRCCEACLDCHSAGRACARAVPLAATVDPGCAGQ